MYSPNTIISLSLPSIVWRNSAHAAISRISWHRELVLGKFNSLDPPHQQACLLSLKQLPMNSNAPRWQLKMITISLWSLTLLIRSQKPATSTQETVRWKKSSSNVSSKKKMRIRRCAKRNSSHKKQKLSHSRKPSKSLSRLNSRNTQMSKLTGSKSTRVRKSTLNSTLLAMWLSQRSKSQENSGNTIRRTIESILERFRISMSTSHWFKLILHRWRILSLSAYCNKMSKNKSKNQLFTQLTHCSWHWWHLRRVNSPLTFLSKKKAILSFSINTKRSVWTIWISNLSMKTPISSLKTRRTWISSASKQLRLLRSSLSSQLSHLLTVKNLKSGIFPKTNLTKLRT